MKKQPNQTMSGTNIEHVKRQNAQKAGSANQNYEAEFASETDPAHVKQQNQKAESNKQNASTTPNRNSK